MGETSRPWKMSLSLRVASKDVKITNNETFFRSTPRAFQILLKTEIIEIYLSTYLLQQGWGVKITSQWWKVGRFRHGFTFPHECWSIPGLQLQNSGVHHITRNTNDGGPNAENKGGHHPKCKLPITSWWVMEVQGAVRSFLRQCGNSGQGIEGDDCQQSW